MKKVKYSMNFKNEERNNNRNYEVNKDCNKFIFLK